MKGRGSSGFGPEKSRRATVFVRFPFITGASKTPPDRKSATKHSRNARPVKKAVDASDIAPRAPHARRPRRARSRDAASQRAPGVLG